MKRHGYIIEQVIEKSNLEESFDYVLRGKKRKNSKAGRNLIKNKEEVIKRLQKEIGDGTYTISEYRSCTIKERDKTRDIQTIPLTDRIALNAIMKIVEKYLNKKFIKDSASSIKGRGIHYLLHRMIKGLSKYKDKPGYVYKCDIKKFYQSINQDAMKFVLHRTFKDKKLLAILDRCISMIPEGLSIGLRSSQALGNLILDYYLDHVIKDELGVKDYYRYCDDEVILSDSFKTLQNIREVIFKQLEETGLEIKSNEQMYSHKDRPIDFLGYQVFSNGKIKIRKHIKKRFAKRWKRVKSKKWKKKIIGAFYGIAKHSHSKNLFKKITGISMKNFSDFGLTFVAKDGKKRFDCQIYSISNLINLDLIILDYETGIKTKEGEDRYIVYFKMESNGNEGKFFTNSEELKQMLDKISEFDDGFPFKTVIKKTVFGNRSKYSFS